MYNARSAAAVSARFAANPLREMTGLCDPVNTLYRHALGVDLTRAARLVGRADAIATALQSLGSTSLDDRQSWYQKVRWSPETDVVVAQVQLVLGLYLGLALPPLFGIGCWLMGTMAGGSSPALRTG